MVRVMMRFGRKDVGFDEKLIWFGSGGEANERRRKKRKVLSPGVSGRKANKKKRLRNGGKLVKDKRYIETANWRRIYIHSYQWIIGKSTSSSQSSPSSPSSPSSSPSPSSSLTRSWRIRRGGLWRESSKVVQPFSRRKKHYTDTDTVILIKT